MGRLNLGGLKNSFQYKNLLKFGFDVALSRCQLLSGDSASRGLVDRSIIISPLHAIAEIGANIRKLLSTIEAHFIGPSRKGEWPTECAVPAPKDELKGL